MDETGIDAMRLALRRAVSAARAGNVPADVRIALLVAELGREMSKAAGDDGLAKLVPGVQAAVEHAARTAHSEFGYEEDAAQLLDQWLN